MTLVKDEGTGVWSVVIDSSGDTIYEEDIFFFVLGTNDDESIIMSAFGSDKVKIRITTCGDEEITASKDFH